MDSSWISRCCGGALELDADWKILREPQPSKEIPGATLSSGRVMAMLSGRRRELRVTEGECVCVGYACAASRGSCWIGHEERNENKTKTTTKKSKQTKRKLQIQNVPISCEQKSPRVPERLEQRSKVKGMQSLAQPASSGASEGIMECCCRLLHPLPSVFLASPDWSLLHQLSSICSVPYRQSADFFSVQRLDCNHCC